MGSVKQKRHGDVRQITLRLYDPKLIEWFDAIENRHGERHRAITDAISRGIHLEPNSVEALLAEVSNSVDLNSFLPEIRRVVEAAIESSLANLALNMDVLQKDDEGEPAAEVEALMQSFDETLLVFLEEDEVSNRGE